MGMRAWSAGVAIMATALMLSMAGCAGTAHTGSRELSIAVRLSSYGRFAEDALPHLQSLGVKYVFMNVPPAERVEAVHQELLDHGLMPLVLRGDVDFTADSGLDALEDQLAACARLGVRYMFLSVKGHWEDPAVAYARLRRAGDMAARHGVVLAIETHPELGTNADVQLATMRGVNHPNVRVNFDTGNISFYNQGRDAVTELRKIVPYVATVEIKDHSGTPQEWSFPALGQGRVDIPGVLKVLRAHHYAGPLTIEIEGIKAAPWNEAQTRAAIAESVRYLRSLNSR